MTPVWMTPRTNSKQLADDIFLCKYIYIYIHTHTDSVRLQSDPKYFQQLFKCTEKNESVCIYLQNIYST